jgi:hypothetical protein
MSWRAQNRPQDAKIRSTRGTRSDCLILESCGIQRYFIASRISEAAFHCISKAAFHCISEAAFSGLGSHTFVLITRTFRAFRHTSWFSLLRSPWTLTAQCLAKCYDI